MSINNEDQSHALLANSGSVVEATYINAELPKFEGNPLILALPPTNDHITATERMQRLPSYEPEMRKLPPHLRAHMCMDVLHFFQPLSIHLRLEMMISLMIRDGYLNRNPFDPANARDLKTKLEYFKNNGIHVTHSSAPPAGFMICGMSGVGKTTSLTRILNLYPQIILHNSFREIRFTQVQISYVLLECPKDGSTKTLCQDFFRTVDHIMCGNTDYVRRFGSDHYTSNQMRTFMAVVAATHKIGMIIIDEIQNLNVAKSGGAEEMLNFFSNLVNYIGVPVVMVGTYDAALLFTSVFSITRRSSGQGDLVWDRLAFDTDSDSDWYVYASSLWEYQFVQKECPITEELSRALHEVSFGVIDIANKIYMAAQLRAIDTGTEEITPGIIRSAYRDNFRLVSRIIEVLKSGSPLLIAQIRDVSPPPIIPIKQKLGSHQPSAGNGVAANTADPNSVSAEQTELDSSQPLSLTDRIADLTAQLSNMSGGMAETGSSEILLGPKQPNTPKKRNKRQVIVAYDSKDLRGVVQNGQASDPPLSPYQALFNAGLIKPASEFSTK